jgi:tight adherence protein B
VALIEAIAFFGAIGLIFLLAYEGWHTADLAARDKRLHRLGHSLQSSETATTEFRASGKLWTVRGYRFAPLDEFDKFAAQAGVKVAPSAFLLGVLLLFVSVGLAGKLWLDWTLSLVLAFGVAAAPIVYLAVLRKPRLRLFGEQLPYLLDLLTSAMESGHTLHRAIQLAAEDLPEPIVTEIRLVIEQAEVGASISEALDSMFKRVPEESIGFLVAAVRLQSEVGSSLTEVIQHVSATLRDRLRLEQQIRTLTAQTRFSATLVSVLPVALLLVFSLIQPDYVWLLFRDPTGQKLLKIAIALNLVALAAMRYLSKVDY